MKFLKATVLGFGHSSLVVALRSFFFPAFFCACVFFCCCFFLFIFFFFLFENKKGFGCFGLRSYFRPHNTHFFLV